MVKFGLFINAWLSPDHKGVCEFFEGRHSAGFLGALHSSSASCVGKLIQVLWWMRNQREFLQMWWSYETLENKESQWERRPDKYEQSAAHFCINEGLCTHSDPDEGKCVFQVYSAPMQTSAYMEELSSCLKEIKGSQALWSRKLFEVCVVNLKVKLTISVFHIWKFARVLKY